MKICENEGKGRVRSFLLSFSFSFFFLTIRKLSTRSILPRFHTLFAPPIAKGSAPDP